MNDSDKNTIVYFWQEKGDLTRWSSWEDMQQEIEEEFPELIAAQKSYEIAERTIDAIVKHVSSTISPDF